MSKIIIISDPPYGMDVDTDYSSMTGWATGKKYDKVLGDNKPFSFDVFAQIKADEVIVFGADYYVETLPNFGKDGSWMVWDKRVDESKDAMFGSGFEMIFSKIRHKRKIYRKQWAGFMGDKDARNRVHPTQKPVDLIVSLIKDFSDEGDIIIDLFGGSGSTLIACEQLNRTCYMMEIDPKYCDVIRKRYAKFIGKEDEWEKNSPQTK